MLKKAIAEIAGRAGYTIIPNWKLRDYPSTVHLTKIFRFLSVDLVIDVGANIGQYHDWLRGSVGYTGQMISFEPTPDLGQKLKEKAKADPKWHIDTRALGSTPGRAIFNIMDNTEFNSFLQPLHEDFQKFTETNRIKDSVDVEVTTLDNEVSGLIDRHQSRSVYLKVDAQGFDLEILRGGKTALASVVALQVEASVQRIYNGSPNYVDIIDYLVSKDFVLSGFFPNNEGCFPEMIEFDCYMIHKSKCDTRRTA